MNILTGPYYVTCNAPRDWLVKFSPTGCNSEIVGQFTSKIAAEALARKLNAKHGDPV